MGNIDTGEIRQMTREEMEELTKAGHRLVEIKEELMTETQRRDLRVALNDKRTALGQLLHKERSRYEPHVGQKQLAKVADRAT